MENKVVKIIWKRGQYLNLYRLTIINSSPLKEGQKVQVIWARLVRSRWQLWIGTRWKWRFSKLSQRAICRHAKTTFKFDIPILVNFLMHFDLTRRFQSHPWQTQMKQRERKVTNRKEKNRKNLKEK